MAPVVRFRAAVATIGRFPALAGVDLELEDGEVAVLEGPNGAGKTSLLRACAGLLPVAAGAAEVCGVDVRRHPRQVRRRVGLLGHSPALYDDLTVTENLRFALRAAGAPVTGAGEVLERLGLGGRLASTPALRLSAGQRRRVALAVVVARRPALWLLDEPHAGLDAAGRELLGELLAEALAQGASALIASHEPEQAVPLADRVLAMGGGRVLESRPGLRKAPPSVTGVIHVA